MRKNWIVYLLLLCAFITAGCSSNKDSETASANSSNDKKIIIRMANTVSDENFLNKGFKKFKEVIEKESGGRVEVQIYNNGTLTNSDNMTMELLQSGAIEMGSIAPYGFASNSNIKAFNIFDFPFLFRDRNEFYKFIDGPYGKKLEEEVMQQTKLKQLGIFDLGSFSITNSKRSILEPEDAKGLKIRSTSSPLHIEALKALGASPTPMAYGEVFTGLQQGTVDGVMTTTPLIYNDKFYEVSPNITLTRHIILPHALQINREFYENLPPDIQELVVKAAKEQVEYTRKLVIQVENEAVGKIKEAGVNVVEPTPEQLDKFKQALQPLNQKNITLVGQENYDFAIEQLRKK